MAVALERVPLLVGANLAREEHPHPWLCVEVSVSGIAGGDRSGNCLVIGLADARLAGVALDELHNECRRGSEW
jgi:hypothetical protein